MRFDVITLFPGTFVNPVKESVLRRALTAGQIQLEVHDLRDWSVGRHRQADDAPFGGGDGMVMMAEPLTQALRAIRTEAPDSAAVLLTPQGRVFTQAAAREFAARPGLILVCGHYAGVDERVAELADEELSVGDYVLSGGELPALLVMEAVTRLLPGVLGNAVSAAEDSFPERLEYPQYTRPADFAGNRVPEVLLSGDHEQVRRWRKKESLRRTLTRRPDLLQKYPPDEEEKKILRELRQELSEGDAGIAGPGQAPGAMK